MLARDNQTPSYIKRKGYATQTTINETTKANGERSTFDPKNLRFANAIRC